MYTQPPDGLRAMGVVNPAPPQNDIWSPYPTHTCKTGYWKKLGISWDKEWERTAVLLVLVFSREPEQYVVPVPDPDLWSPALPD